jgi:hypothetical protein
VKRLIRKTKNYLRGLPLVREAVRQYRYRTRAQKWSHVVADQASHLVPANPVQRVLIATSDGAHLAGTRMESLIGIALRLRNAEAEVLLCDGILPACIECNRDWYPDPKRIAAKGPTFLHCNACFSPAFKMYESTGVKVHRYSDWLTAEDYKKADALANAVDLDRISDFTYEELRVGEHALAGTLRYYAAAFIEHEPERVPILRRYLKASLLTAICIRRLLRERKIDAAVFHHGIYVPHGIIGEVCRQDGVRVVNWHVAYREKSFIFSHGDTYHHTLMDEPVSAWESMPWNETLEEETVKYLNSRWYGTGDWIKFHREPQFDTDAIAREIGVDFSKPCIGALTNVMWDAQLHYPANAFPNMLDWMLTTIDYFARRPELQLLVRVHPAEITGTLLSRQPIMAEVAKVWPVLPANVFFIPPDSKASTYAAMSKCDAVLIYGTKTGVEVSSMGIPVIVAGEAWIRNKGITQDAKSAAHYIELLDRLPLKKRLTPELTGRARKYAFHFFFRRMIPVELFRNGPHGLELHVENIDQIRPGASLGLDVICDGILRGTPFIYPAEQLLTTSIETTPSHATAR